MLLYAESLGASAKITGVIFGLTPLMVALQIPAAGYVSQFGYKRFIATGWTIRLIFVLPLIAVPLLHGRVSQEAQLAMSTIADRSSALISSGSMLGGMSDKTYFRTSGA